MDAADVQAVLERLERGETCNPVRLASEPRTLEDAVAAWVRARAMKRGAHFAPLHGLAKAYATHAQESGWELESLHPNVLGRLLARLGYVRCKYDWERGFRVDVDTAHAMRLLCPPKRPTRRVKRHRQVQPPAPPRLPFFPLPPRARPLVTPEGRVYPTARVAAELTRCVSVNVQQAAAHGGRAGGSLWRYLRPEEVARLPPTTLAGEVVPWLDWRGTVAVQCPGCGAGLLEDGRADGDGCLAPPTPQVSPTPLPLGPQGRGVTHIP